MPQPRKTPATYRSSMSLREALCWSALFVVIAGSSSAYAMGWLS